MTRRAGVLAHVSSLPGAADCGDFGDGTVRFLDWCVAAGIRIWQVLPLGPPGPGDSPYAAQSAFAGNPLWCAATAVKTTPSTVVANFTAARMAKNAQLERAWTRFRARAEPAERASFEAFCDAPGRSWLHDWSLFAALKEHHSGLPWMNWDDDLQRREPGALRRAARTLTERVRLHRFIQFTVDRQARVVRAACEARDILWVGDLPFYVALDSADVWARRDLFRVAPDGRPAALAGVPPDDFSNDGQLWNNPLFDWEAMRGDRYSWWIKRCRTSLRWVHALRLDHFRGYEAFWEVPAGSQSAAQGRWEQGPGESLFDAVRDAGLDASLIAEDLGEITPAVDALRERYRFPGMHVLQFGLDDSGSTHHPNRHQSHALACTGTHDNNTFLGWFSELDSETRTRVAAVLGSDERSARLALQLCWSSRANWAIAPLQDLLELDGSARMNHPGVASGQWIWRADDDALTAELALELRALTERAHRD